MKLTEDVLGYLRGTEFTNSGTFSIERSPILDRASLLMSASRGKRVLHVGCADHVELINSKRAGGTYLHDQLASVASEVVGVDTNARALEQMRQQGIDNLFTYEELSPDYTCELIVAPDVIEHVGNVEHFLHRLGQFKCPVLITTPNALRLGNRTRWESELVNSDHRYWFSPYTLARTVTAAGFGIEKTWYTGAFAKRKPIRSLIQRRYPLTRDGLALLAVPPV